MHTRIASRLGAASLCGGVLALALGAVSASAHAVVTAGPYKLAIGWQFEPASGTQTYVDQINAVQLFVDSASGSPVSDLNQDCTHPDLQVTVTYANVTSSPYCPAPAYDPDTGSGRMDEYDHALIPTRVGNYTFHVFGNIHGTAVDTTVTSGPSTFDSVGDSTAVQFPTAEPALSVVATQVQAVSARASTDAQQNADSANRSTVIAVIALIIAVLGSAGAVVFALRQRRA